MFVSDLRYALRTLRRSPGFATSAVLALALGIGANTAVFSVVYAVLLKPLPFAEPDRLVKLTEWNPESGSPEGSVSAGTFADWRARSRSLERLAVYTPFFNGETIWTIGDRAQIVRTAGISPDLFSILRVQPIVGRSLRSETDPVPEGSPGQFVIGYGLWQRAFGGAPDIVGRRVMLEGRLPREIVGVMPPGFDFPAGTEAWTGVPLTDVKVAARRARSFNVVARLAPQATIESARRELAGISAQLASEFPASNRGWQPAVEPLGGADAATAKPALVALLGAVGGVLLIGCANVANLLLARALARRRELAVRLALGAGSGRVVRQYVTEAALIALAGVATGLLLGRWLAIVLVRLAPPDIPRLPEAGLNGMVLIFAVAAGAFCVAATGLAPAVHAIRVARDGGLRPDTRSGTERGARTRRWLIAGEVAIVVVLLAGALLFLRTFVKLRGVDLGFEPARVMVVETRWPVSRIFQAPGSRPGIRVQRAVDRLVELMETIPGVEAAGLVTEVPLSGGDPANGTVWRADAGSARGVAPPADPRDRWQADVSLVTSGYFPSMGIAVLRGRNFAAADRFSEEQLNDVSLPRNGVAIVNATFASRYFAGENPLGQTLVLPEADAYGASRTIVGVVGDVRGRTVAEEARPAVFIPHAQNPDVLRPSLVLRSSLPPDAIAAAVRQRIAGFDAQLLILRIRPMDAVLSAALSRPRFNLLLLSSFALVALVLAAVGIYGVVSFLVAQRTREIGIRIALGARAADVLRLVVADGMMPVAAGAVAGLLAAAAAARAMRSLLFGVTSLDAVSFAAAPALLILVALLACYLPARRAAAVDPLVALREE